MNTHFELQSGSEFDIWEDALVVEVHSITRQVRKKISIYEAGDSNSSQCCEQAGLSSCNCTRLSREDLDKDVCC